MKSKKKSMLIIGGVLAVCVIAGAGWWFLAGKESSEAASANSVFVDSVKNIMGLGSGNGTIGRYSGVVEPQKTWEIKNTDDQKVGEIFVKEGDEVKKGDKLFAYDTTEAEENLVEAEINLDSIANDIETTKAQIENLKKEKAEASADEQLGYTTQINTAENSVKKSEYEQKSKKAEIEKLKKNIANSEVVSEIDGVVKSINDSSSDSANYSEDSNAFMTILATGSFRVKGTINEQNRYELSEGEAVLVHSRVDDTVWKGTISSVDTENPEKNQNDMYYSSGSDMETSSNYPFYVELEKADDLMLGQHVYIEKDNGQEKEREGLWLDAYYILQEEDKAYVWAADSKEKIEKREITLGEFDEELNQYQITEGLTQDDYIAFPQDGIVEGAPAEKNIDQINNGNTVPENGEEAMPEEDMGGSMPMEDDMGDSPDDSMDDEMNEADLGDGSAPAGAETEAEE